MVIWSVLLEGQYRPYDAAVADQIERAFSHGDDDVCLDIRGRPYIICFKPRDGMRQKQGSDPKRSRPVRREDPAPRTEPEATARLAAAGGGGALPAGPQRAPTALAPSATKRSASASAATMDPPFKAPKPSPLQSDANDVGALSAGFCRAVAASAAGCSGTAAPGGTIVTGVAVAGVAESAKAAPPSTNNERIKDMLVELSDTERLSGNLFKASAYRKAAEAVRAHPHPITSGKAAAKELPGIGMHARAHTCAS